MYNRRDLVKAMGKAAVNAVNASMPTAVLVGVVETQSPLSVRVEQRLVLGEKQLLIADTLKSRDISISVETTTETAEGHRHAIRGSKTVSLQAGLYEGDAVILFRMQGGQKYIVLDKISGVNP